MIDEEAIRDRYETYPASVVAAVIKHAHALEEVENEPWVSWDELDEYAAEQVIAKR